MFDTLTKNDLFALHTKLCNEAIELHNRFMALPSATSAEANIILAKHAEISDTMNAVYAEIDRRDEEARTDA